MDEWKRPVADLGKLVINQGENTANLLGQLNVVVLALGALVRTHPAPQAFAAEMRRVWLQAELPLESTETDEQLRSGIEQVLEILEEKCRAPLNIRPPGAAVPPEDPMD